MFVAKAQMKLGPFQVQTKESKFEITGRRKSWLGSSVSDITPELRERLDGYKGAGLYVSYVYSQGSAKEADLRSGDIIVGVNGKRAPTATDFRRTITAAEIGMAVPIVFVRGDKRHKATLTIGTREQAQSR